MTIKKAGLLLIATLQAGCSVWFQKDDTVLIREPDQSSYTAHERARDIAQVYWEYTALAANAYQLAWPDYRQKLALANNKAIQSSVQDRFAQACRPHSKQLIPTPGWYAWPEFPSQAMAEQAEKAKLFFSVWELRTGNEPTDIAEVAIVFRGTEADQRQDWFSNARWFIPTRLRGEDQYDITRDWVAKAFEAEVQERIRQGKLPATVKIVAIGHSLGGGLAQQLAYALPRSVQQPIRVSKVIAFNSSPVTGWFSTGNPPRDENTKGLEIDRIFEHGEALAYIRLPINMVAPPNKRDSAVKDLRFNLKVTPGGVTNHGSQFFACRLAEVAGATKGTINTESFAAKEEGMEGTLPISAMMK
ncbi:lipase family protein [Pseudomonas sp. CG7]|uniref:lipase family protein n=1 Tax=Pseudomonas sp. CG7 TaxID=191007 RepID=UPI0020349815|nr:lipase family protein [Pseudomonas sp. CG7]MCM2461102.1 lipase family protein [Pseudomonas sp. CG7]